MLFLMMFALTACDGGASAPKPPANPGVAEAVPVAGYQVVNVFNHDRDAFTQGLFFHDGHLFESTGQYGESTLRKVELTTGKVLKRHAVPKEFFAEGTTLLNGKIYQLTWQEGTAFVYDLDFKLLKEFRYAGEGWGLTSDGRQLIMSDGTHVIRFIDPETFETMKTVTVKDEKGRVIPKLNELEYINGEIWANIWHSETLGKPNHIARIDPQTGKLNGWVNLQGISPEDVARDPENTLNGIAYDPVGNRIFVTGKQWQRLFEIRLKAK